jgi:hypothetical protein
MKFWDRLAGRAPLDVEDLGVVAVQLALDFPAWVRRRRFVVDYVDDATIQQRMSIDFTLPLRAWFWSTVAPREGATVYVPIYLPAKDTLDKFSVYDEDGRRLTMLPTSDNGALAVAGLLPLVRGLALERLSDDDVRRVLPLLESEIKKVVMAPKRPGALTAEEVMAAAFAGPLGEVLRAEDLPTTMLQDLAAGFLMLVPIPYHAGLDRLLKAEWDIPAYWVGGRGVRRHVQSWLAAIGWADKRQVIPRLQIGYARSTHVEVAAPDEVEMAAVSLMAEQYDPFHAGAGPVGVTRTVFSKPRATINIAPRVDSASLVGDAGRRDHAMELLQARSDVADVEIRFRSPASGVLVAATTASAMLAVLIWVASAHLASLDRQTFSAVLLVFPAILAAYLLRPGEHAFARRLLAGVRLCGLGVAVCSVAVSTILGVAALTEPTSHSRRAPTIGSRQVSCSVQNASVRTGGQRTKVPRALRCRTSPPVTASVQANQSTHDWIERIARVATVLTGILVFGWLRTWWWSDLRNRRRPEEYDERPPR